VQHSLKLPGTIDHISCGIIGEETIEAFARDGLSMLEKEIAERDGDTE
jgi:hypothetical protein